jgi:hypothetical protein
MPELATILIAEVVVIVDIRVAVSKGRPHPIALQSPAAFHSPLPPHFRKK